MNQIRLASLIEKIISGTASPEEIAEISNAIRQQDDNNLVEEIHALISAHEEQQPVFEEKKWDLIADKILKTDNIKKTGNNKLKIISVYKKLAVAAEAVLVLGSALYVGLKSTNKKISAADTTRLKDVAAPKQSNAVLTLSDGTKIELDSANIGALSTDGNADITKLASGEIKYNPLGIDVTQEIMYNTLTVPRGSKLVSITLSDGTKVWLNNESTLRYPVSFSGTERRIEITGEAYFEVSKNDKIPFFVVSNKTIVKVLGTHFNVNAYPDESFLKVTLLEGAVNVSNAGMALNLKPGQQAHIAEDIQLNTSCNIEEVMAWKNERFAFYETDIKALMHQLARWYDLDVEFKGAIKEKFHVETTRNTNVSNVFKILEATGGVHFTVDGKKIVVMP